MINTNTELLRFVRYFESLQQATGGPMTAIDQPTQQTTPISSNSANLPLQPVLVTLDQAIAAAHQLIAGALEHQPLTFGPSAELLMLYLRQLQLLRAEG